MKKAIGLTVAAIVALTAAAIADTTIDPVNHSAWGANIGFTDWRPSTTDGVNIGANFCAGFIYAANVGWTDTLPPFTSFVLLTQTTGPAVSWTATSTQPWLLVANGSGPAGLSVTSPGRYASRSLNALPSWTRCRVARWL